MTVEDITNWGEVQTLTLEEIPERQPGEPRYRPGPIRITRPFRFMDALRRDIEPGDILVWLAGGYFQSYYNYGVVVRLCANERNRHIRVRNTNGNEITIWNVFNTIILAKYGQYETIPEQTLNHLGIENF